MKEGTTPNIDFMIVNVTGLNLCETWTINFSSLTPFLSNCLEFLELPHSDSCLQVWESCSNGGLGAKYCILYTVAKILPNNRFNVIFRGKCY